MKKSVWLGVPALLGLFLLWPLSAQTPPPKKDGKAPPAGQTEPPPFGPKMMIGGPMGQERKVVKQFDKDGDGRLNETERQAAREFLKKDRPGGGRPFGPPGGPGGFGKERDPAKPGPRVAPADVKHYPDSGLYEPTILRTIFIEFDNNDWEAELADFHNTDVEVPATLIVDGKKYPNVGIHFRGMSSYMMAPPGYKRSLNLSIDYVDGKQRLYGYKTLNLLNNADNPSLMSTVLYSYIARQFMPAPKANFVKVVINGESWGIYTNAQQFNKEFLADFYKTTKGTRWKASMGMGGGAGLEYLGDNVADYRRRYEIKSKDEDKPWQDLIALCRTLNQTPPDKLEAALKPILDVDGLLWFLALDVALINNDGYWARGCDYSLYQDDKGKFHVIPHDMNEAFKTGMGGPGGPGGGFVMRLPGPGEILPAFIQDNLQLSGEQRKQLAELQKEIDAKLEKLLTAEQRAQLKAMREAGPPLPFGPPPGGPPPGGPAGPGGMRVGPMGGGGIDLDPLVGLDDARKPLRSKILAVPAFRARYLANIRTIAEKSLDWKQLGPVVAQYRNLIEKEVEADTRKLSTFEVFQRATADAPAPAAPGTGGRGLSLRSFAEQRSKYLLGYAEKKAP